MKHILLLSALLKNNLLQKQKSTFCPSKVTCVSDKTTTLMWSWRNLCKTTNFLMVDNVSSHQSLWWEIVFFVKKICYNLTVYVTLYYTLANIDPSPYKKTRQTRLSSCVCLFGIASLACKAARAFRHWRSVTRPISRQGSNASHVCLYNENTKQLTSDALTRMHTDGCPSRPPHQCSLHDDVSNANY